MPEIEVHFVKIPTGQGAEILEDIGVSGKKYGYQIAKSAGISLGSIYTQLQRLGDSGFVSGEVESLPGGSPKRAIPRRYYKLTPLGEKVLKAIEDLKKIAKSRSRRC